MTSKLTLTIEKNTIRLAKTYAQKKGESLSRLIENYLKIVVSKDDSKDELSPTIKRLQGSVKVPKNFNYKKILEEEIGKKYWK